MPSRTLPNIIVTGTPGVGKTTTCEELASVSANTSIPLKHLSINQIVKDKDCHEGYDEELETHIVDEEKMLDEVESILGVEKDGEVEDQSRPVEGGWLIDYHACDLFPLSWIDLVVVLRCENTQVLYDRLKARDYPEKKLQENLDAEIFGVLGEEAREGFDEGMVVELSSESVEDVEGNCQRIMQWVESWVKGRKGGSGS